MNFNKFELSEAYNRFMILDIFFVGFLPLFRLDFVKYCGYQDWKDRSLK